MNKKKLSLGVVGLSDGNGHPYSWSAIINGYDAKKMATCPFPAIPDYLSKEVYPDNFIKNVEVTRIWTQEREISEHIAAASKISIVVDQLGELSDGTDAILLARDDYQNHLEFAEHFIESKLPIYIDKPLANSVEGAQALLSKQKFETQIFSCSALRYGRELDSLRPKTKSITGIKAQTPKSWSLYGIHIIDPVISLLGTDVKILAASVGDNDSAEVNTLINNIPVQFQATGKSTGTIHLDIQYDDGKTEQIVFGDMFYAFKAALCAFLDQVRTHRLAISRQETLTSMQIIQAAKLNQLP